MADLTSAVTTPNGIADDFSLSNFQDDFTIVGTFSFVLIHNVNRLPFDKSSIKLIQSIQAPLIYSKLLQP